jgi:hypothetical protein
MVVRRVRIPAKGDAAMKNAHTRILLCSLAALAGDAGCSGLRPGTAAPDFTLASMAGENVSLSTLTDRPVVLTYFATW